MDFDKLLPYDLASVDPNNPLSIDLTEPIELMPCWSPMASPRSTFPASPTTTAPDAAHNLPPMTAPAAETRSPASSANRHRAKVQSRAPDLPFVGSGAPTCRSTCRTARRRSQAGPTSSASAGWSSPIPNSRRRARRPPSAKALCRTFSDCTTAPRASSGYYPSTRTIRRSPSRKLIAIKQAWQSEFRACRTRTVMSSAILFHGGKSQHRPIMARRLHLL